MANTDPLPDPSSPRPPSENLKPLMKMLDMLDTPSTPPSRLDKLRAWRNQYAPRVLALVGTFWGKAVLGVAAAAALGGTVWHLAHHKPAAPILVHQHPMRPEPVHSRAVHKHPAVKHPPHKTTHKKSKSHKKHPAANTSK